MSTFQHQQCKQSTIIYMHNTTTYDIAKN